MKDLPPDPDSAECQTIQLLLIEDNPGDARLAQLYLCEDAAFPVNIVTMGTLGEGIEMVKAEVFDIVLLDLSLPDSTGMATFRTFFKAVPHLPIVVLSGQEDEALARKLVQMGAQDSVPKDLMSGPLMRRTASHAIERKQIHEQLRTMQEQLIQAEKMESVGRLAAGVAHEVKNPLARISMGMDYLSSGVQADDPNLPGVLAKMRDALKRADIIIRGLLDFASARKLGLVDGSLNDVVRASLVLVNHEVNARRIVLCCDFGESLPLVKMDVSKVEHVLVNVILNAIHAIDETEEDGHLTIRTYTDLLGNVPHNEGSRTARQLRSGDRVVILELADTGCGLPKDSEGNLWDPFFTTKPPGVGTGLGLTVVQKIIEMHRGLISLENRPEGGVLTRIILSEAETSPLV